MRTGFTLCSAEKKQNVEGGWGNRWGGVKKTLLLNSLMEADRPEAGGGAGARKKSVIRQLELSALGDQWSVLID